MSLSRDAVERYQRIFGSGLGGALRGMAPGSIRLRPGGPTLDELLNRVRQNQTEVNGGVNAGTEMLPEARKGTDTVSDIPASSEIPFSALQFVLAPAVVVPESTLAEKIRGWRELNPHFLNCNSLVNPVRESLDRGEIDSDTAFGILYDMSRSVVEQGRGERKKIRGNTWEIERIVERARQMITPHDREVFLRCCISGSFEATAYLMPGEPFHLRAYAYHKAGF